MNVLASVGKALRELLPEFVEYVIERLVRGDKPEDIRQTLSEMRAKVKANRAEIDDALDDKHGG